MTITEQFKAKRCVFSIECFPPKQTTQMDKLKDTLRQMQAMDPGFISVTFGAGGSAGGVSAACPTGRHPKPDQRGTQTFRRGRYLIRHCRNSERCMELPDAAPRRKL